nr:hypothetical protein [Desulfobacter hydrogenophilus]
MNTTLTDLQNQITNSEQIGVLNDFFTKFKIGTLLNQSGIVKTKGASPLAIFTALFNLAFHNKNLYQGIVKNKKIKVDKDAAYNFLNSPTYNRRRFTLHLCRRIYFVIRKLLDDSSEEVLIFDDSTLMDSWFSMPSVIADLREHIHVICMLKAASKMVL